MKIDEISNGMKDIEISGKISEVTEPRTVNTKFGPNVVANAVMEDGSGKIKLVLWGKQISSVKKGDSVTVRGAYATEWNNDLQLNIPKAGELVVEDN